MIFNCFSNQRFLKMPRPLPMHQIVNRWPEELAYHIQYLVSLRPPISWCACLNHQSRTVCIVWALANWDWETLILDQWTPNRWIGDLYIIVLIASLFFLSYQHRMDQPYPSLTTAFTLGAWSYALTHWMKPGRNISRGWHYEERESPTF